MGVNMCYSVRWQLSQAQIEQLYEITDKYEQGKKYQYLKSEYCMESLFIAPDEREPDTSELEANTHQSNKAMGVRYWGAVKYPNAVDFLDLSDFEGVVLAWLSEVRRTFGGDDWQVYRQDFELVPWVEESQSYYHDPL